MKTGKALDLAFPGCKVERTQVLLGDEKKAAVAKLCGQKFDRGMVFPYVAKRGGKVVGTAWFDTHKVRSKRQLLMVAIDPQQRVMRVEVLAFAEPDQYDTPKAWRGRIVGKSLGEVAPGKGVPRITGATLTVNATTRCVDRVLALHRVVFGPPPGSQTPDSKQTRSKPTSKPSKREAARPDSRPTSRPVGGETR